MEKKRIFFWIVFLTLQQFLEAQYCELTSLESVSCREIFSTKAVSEVANSKTKELNFINCNVDFGGGFENLTNIEKLTIISSGVDFDLKPVSLKFPKLKILNFFDIIYTSNSINTYDKLTSLITLSLENGFASVIFYNAFKNYSVGLSSLITLSLKENHILDIEGFSFRALNKLENLHLGGNKISLISREAFAGLDSLKLLNLSSNHIKDLPFYLFLYTPELKTLYLDNNRIQYLNGLMFEGLPKLNALYLQLNKITHIEPDTFDNFKIGKSLSKLYLFGNDVRLHTTLFKNFDSLSELMFDGTGLVIKKCAIMNTYYESVLALTC